MNDDRSTRSAIETDSRGRQPLVLLFFAVISMLVLYATWKVLFPFATPILLGCVIVVLTYPLFVRLTAKLKGRENLAAAIMLAGVTVTIIIPALLLTMMLIDQANDLFRTMQDADVHGVIRSLKLSERMAILKRIAPSFDPATIKPEGMIVGAVKKIPGMVAAYGTVFIAGFANFVLSFFLMLFAMFFFYTEGPALLKDLKYLSPLPDRYDVEIYDKFRDVVDATFRGMMLTALAQGAATGVGLAIVGIPGAMFWGAVSALTALIPMVGPAAIWLPSAIYLFIRASAGSGDLWRGFFLIAWGIFVVSLIDNIIRPWAMKGGMKMSAAILLFSILGGMKAFGFVGLLLGPLAIALLAPVVAIYKQLFRETLGAEEGELVVEADPEDM